MSNNSPLKSPSRPADQAGRGRHSVAWFLALLVLLCVVAPFVQELPQGRFLESTILTVVLLGAVVAVGGSRRTLLAALALSVPMILAAWAQLHRAEGVGFTFCIAAFLVFIGHVIFHFLRFIFRAQRVNSEVLCAGAAVYLLLGFTWAAAYALTARLIPGAFSGLAADVPRLQGFDALYFSLITLTTVGYGDIQPVAHPARMLAMMEAVTANMFLAVVISRLVSLYSSGDSDKDGEAAPGR
jgi:voltage-gated potassium channel